MLPHTPLPSHPLPSYTPLHTYPSPLIFPSPSLSPLTQSHLPSLTVLAEDAIRAALKDYKTKKAKARQSDTEVAAVAM